MQEKTPWFGSDHRRNTAESPTEVVAGGCLAGYGVTPTTRLLLLGMKGRPGLTCPAASSTCAGFQEQ